MTKIRILSPKLVADAVARRIDISTEKDLAVKVVISRSNLVGPQDYESCRDYRLEQLLGFGLIDDAEVRRAIGVLEERGHLVDAAQAAAELDSPRPAEEAQVLEARARLAAITNLTETVAGDVGGMGPHALTVTPDLVKRLASIQQELDAIARDLHAARTPYVTEQVDRLGVAGRRDLKLHLGAGPTHLEGWVNADVVSKELAFNLSWGLPFEDGSVSFIYAGHVFEHLYYAAEALQLLREVHRVLRPGGVFRFIVPDMGLFLQKYAAGDRGFFDYWRKNAVKYFNVFDTPMEIVMMYCNVGRDPSEYFIHKMGYDFETIEKLGRRTGFAKVTRSDYMASEHPELRVDEISVAARLAYEGQRYSLFVELER